MWLCLFAPCPVAGRPAKIRRHCENISIISSGKGTDLLVSSNAVYDYCYNFGALRIC